MSGPSQSCASVTSTSTRMCTDAQPSMGLSSTLNRWCGISRLRWVSGSLTTLSPTNARSRSQSCTASSDLNCSKTRTVKHAPNLVVQMRYSKQSHTNCIGTTERFMPDHTSTLVRASMTVLLCRRHSTPSTSTKSDSLSDTPSQISGMTSNVAGWRWMFMPTHRRAKRTMIPPTTPLLQVRRNAERTRPSATAARPRRPSDVRARHQGGERARHSLQPPAASQ